MKTKMIDLVHTDRLWTNIVKLIEQEVPINLSLALEMKYIWIKMTNKKERDKYLHNFNGLLTQAYISANFCVSLLFLQALLLFFF